MALLAKQTLFLMGKNEHTKALDALPAAGDALKTSFVKVYLKRG